MIPSSSLVYLVYVFAFPLSSRFAVASVPSTLLRFSRKFSTCDSSDVDITDVTNRVIWAYGSSAPEGEGSGSGGVGGHVDRGSLSLRLRSGGPPPYPSDEPINSIDFIVDDVTITPDDVPSQTFQFEGIMIDNGGEDGPQGTTSYFCRGINATHLNDAPQHAIGFEPIITPGNEKKVHHILLYECPGLADDPEAASFSGNCWADSTPSNIKACNFGNVISAWAIGGEPSYFPPEAGMKVGNGAKHGGYYMMEIHYDNYDSATFKDSSGLKMLYTPTLRPNDVGIMYTGALVGIDIPPNQERYDLNARCPWGCTANVPPTGIKVFNSLLHAHTAGVSVRASLLSKFGDYKASLGTEDYYDFNYQTPIPLDVTIHKDDEIHTRCSYNTMGRSTNTKFGLATGDEMCLTYLWYYPEISDSARCLFANIDNPTLQSGDSLRSIVPEPTEEGLLPIGICDANFFNFASSDDATYPVEYCERDDTTPVEIEKWSVTGNGDDVDLDAQYDFKEDINEKVSIYYSVDSTKSELHMAIRADTEGWVGVGFGGGKMKGSDIVMGWVNEDGGWVSDRFAEGNWEPAVDQLQDYYNLAVYSGTCNEGDNCQWSKASANPLNEDIILGAGVGRSEAAGTLFGLFAFLFGLWLAWDE
mmetsp:Transcript_9062/g.18318  ORF Transcript_9062/g.18318 Transcript_9062/m.18318 type:complete len:643 (-) Transcript_9062:35-1963(-)